MGDTVRLVNGLGLVGGVIFGVEVLDRGQELIGNTVLGVEVDCLLNSRVTNDVSVGEVLGNNTAARLLLLCDLVAVSGVVVLVVVIVAARTGASAFDLDLGETKSRVV